MAASAAFSHARYFAVFTRPPREAFKNRLLTDGEKRKIAEKGFTPIFFGYNHLPSTILFGSHE